VQSELVQHAAHDLGVGHFRFLLLAHLHRSRLNRALECQQAAPGVVADAERAAAAPQRFVIGVEEGIAADDTRYRKKSSGPSAHDIRGWRRRCYSHDTAQTTRVVFWVAPFQT